VLDDFFTRAGGNGLRKKLSGLGEERKHLELSRKPCGDLRSKKTRMRSANSSKELTPRASSCGLPSRID